MAEKRPCLECRTEIERTRTGYDSQTKQPIYRRFCSKSCAASYNNRRSPKRSPQGTCKNCGDAMPSSLTYCSRECNNEYRGRKSIEDWEAVTKKDMIGDGNANYSKWPYVRSLSRRKYLGSDKPQECVVCGYDLHFDVAHIKPCESFDGDALIAEINHLDNLIALCRNHHWEFDNGYLELDL